MTVKDLLRKGQNIDEMSDRLGDLDPLTPIQQAQLLKSAFTYFEKPKDFKKILNILIESGKIDFSKALTQNTKCVRLNVLEVTEPSPDSSVLMNDLAEHVGKRMLLSANTAKTHIKSVLLDTVIDSPKGKPTRIRGLSFKSGAMKNVIEQ